MSEEHEQEQKISTVEKLAEANVVEIKVLRGSEAYNEALLKEKPSFNNLMTWRLIGCLLLGCFCQTMNGFDGMLFGNLSANPQFLAFFNGATSGGWQALTSVIYQVGGLAALPFVGFCVDSWGRKPGMFIGATIIIIGCIVNGTTVLVLDPARATRQLQAGRFVLGFGVSIVSAAGPIYVVETAHPAWRSIITAYCNTFWFIGSVLASGAARGSVVLSGTVSWQIPIWLQVFFPGLIFLFAWFIPESPRWLYVHNKREQSLAVLTKWHGKGNPESPWVKLQTAEYEEFLNTNGADKRFWDFSALYRGRSNRYRLACNGVFSAAGQLAGNNAFSYYLPAVLTLLGIASGVPQTNFGLGYSIFQWVFSLLGAALVERVGRRKLMLFSMGGSTIVWAILTATGGVFAASGQNNHTAGNAFLAFVFIFGAVYSVGITPLQALYPVEVLSFEQRAKGMAFSSLCVNAALVLSGNAFSLGINKIGWHFYIVFLGWDAVQTTIFYFLMPETRRRTLEELDKIFEAPNPVKESLKPRKVAVDADGTVLAAEDA